MANIIIAKDAIAYNAVAIIFAGAIAHAITIIATMANIIAAKAINIVAICIPLHFGTRTKTIASHTKGISQWLQDRFLVFMA